MWYSINCSKTHQLSIVRHILYLDGNFQVIEDNPAGQRRNNNAIIMSKRRRKVVLTK